MLLLQTKEEKAMRLCEYIKYKRQSIGYSLQQLAEALGVSKQAVSKWESGTALPNIMTIPDLATMLRVTPEKLMNIIWIGETGEVVEHFIHLIITESNGDEYALMSYRYKNFVSAKNKFEDIANGRIATVLDLVVDYYSYDPTRTIQLSLVELVFHDDPEPEKSLQIEHIDLTPLAQSHTKAKTPRRKKKTN